MPFYEVTTGIPSKIVVEAESPMEAVRLERNLFAKFLPIFSPEDHTMKLLCGGCGAVLFDNHVDEIGGGDKWLLVFDPSGNFKWLCMGCTQKRGILDEIHERHHRHDHETVDPHEIAMNPDGTG